jgi:hypothetical protein
VSASRVTSATASTQSCSGYGCGRRGRFGRRSSAARAAANLADLHLDVLEVASQPPGAPFLRLQQLLLLGRHHLQLLAHAQPHRPQLLGQRAAQARQQLLHVLLVLLALVRQQRLRGGAGSSEKLSTGCTHSACDLSSCRAAR